MNIPATALAWITGNDTGTSSKTIFAVMAGGRPNDKEAGYFGNHPCDPADLGRCIRLLEKVPEWRPRLREMRAVSLAWESLVNHWDELEALYRKELPTGMARKCYDRMQELIEFAENKPTEAPMKKT